MSKKYKLGNSVTNSLGFVQSLVGKCVAVRDGDFALCEEVVGVQVYLCANGVQGVKLHLKGVRGFYHLDDVICIYEE